MKKNILFILLLFSSPLKIDAQYFSPHYVRMDKYKVLDSAYLKFTYKLTCIKDTLNPKKTTVTDMQVLLIGAKISKYFSQYVFDYNKRIQKLLQEGARSIPTNGDGFGYEVFKNYPPEKFTVTDLGTSVRGNYLYEEAIPDQNWKISMDSETILSYTCQKATTTFRGRDYTAWFTMGIPIGNGPWKFGGLPGIILKVSDLQQNYIFECIGIESLKKKEPIKLYQLDYTPIDRKDLNKLYFRYHNNYVEFSKSFGVKVRTPDGRTLEHTETKIPYNPIELR